MSSTEQNDDADVKLTDTNLDDVFEDEIETNKTSEETEALDAFSAAPPPPVKRGVGWGAVLPLFILAAAGGAAGGWALTQYVMPNYIALPQSDAPKLSGAEDTLEASRPAASANDAPAAFTDSLEAFETRLVVLEKSFAEVATLSETESQMLEGTPEEMAAAEEARAAREARYDTLKAELETMRARVSRLETDITAP